jgi:hypothetical protein
LYASPSFSVRPLSSHALVSVMPPKEALSVKSPLIAHLALESELLSLVGPLSTAFQRVRNARMYDRSRINLLRDALHMFQTQLAAWRDDVKQAHRQYDSSCNIPS